MQLLVPNPIARFGSLNGDIVLYLHGAKLLCLVNDLVGDRFLSCLISSLEAYDVGRDQEAATVLLTWLDLGLFDDQFPNGRLRSLDDLRDRAGLAALRIDEVVGADLNRRAQLDGEVLRL